jgi:TRAP-type mannitol/chloroaromatic compound transport system permease small subunit
LKIFLEKLIEWTGRISSWFSFFLILLVGYDVISRYFFDSSSAWIMELEWHFFAIIFLIGSAYCFKQDQHVRVDLFYSDFSEKDKSLVNLIGGIFLLVPWCVFIIWSSFSYAKLSLDIMEKSPDPGGLPFRFVIKFIIVIGFILLLIQGIISIVNSFRIYFFNEIGEKG